MSRKAKFLYTDYVSGASSISATDTASGFSVDNLRTNSLLVPHRSQTDANINYIFDLGASYSIGAVAIIGHNVTSAGIALLQRASNLAFSSGVADVAQIYYAAGTDVGTYNETCMWASFTPQSERYLRVTIADGANPDTYIEVGRMMIGPYFEPVECFEPGYGRDEEPGSLRQRAMNGAENFVVRPDASGRTVRFPINTVAELELWRTFARTVSTHKPFAMALDEDNLPIDSLFVRCRNPIQLPRVFLPETSEAILDVRQVIG